MKTPWVLAMDWRDALFLHWQIAPAALRPLIPPDLEIDLFDEHAWIGIVAFRIAHARLRGFPAVLGSSFPEINVRTYVRGERDGVWFFSLDAANRVAVELARTAIHLPYYRASIATHCEPDRCTYSLQRSDSRAPEARFRAQAQLTGGERVAACGTLEHFLLERYCFYARTADGRIIRGDVNHPPWPVRDAQVTVEENTLIAATRLAIPASPPLVHASRGVATQSWPPVRDRGAPSSP